MILYPEAIWDSDMGHCYGNDLRRRVVEAITGGGIVRLNRLERGRKVS